MKRRSFLRHMTHGLAIPGVVSSFGYANAQSQAINNLLRFANETDRVLVLVFLEGGNDGLNTVVPLESMSAMNAVRPHVILPDSSLIEIPGKNLALHPEMADLKALYDEGRFGIIQNVGYPDPNFSHFRSTDIWMSASDSNELINTGWIGRYLNQEYPTFPEEYPNEENPHPLAIELGYGSSLLFQGPTSSMGMVINDPEYFYELINNEEEEAPDTNAGDKLRYVRLVARQSQQYGQVVVEAAEKVTSQSEYQGDFLSQQLRIVSRLIAGGLQTPLYMVRIGGFDTHDAQVESGDHTTGEHATLLRNVNNAIRDFMKDLEFQGTDDRVVGMTFSEFGRRIVSNASLGTDHGTAAPLFVFGNNVRGGVLGDNPVVTSNMVYDDNLEMQYDFRQVYASMMEQWFGQQSTGVSDVLLDDFDTIPIIGDSVITDVNPPISQEFKVFPNPLIGQANIELITDGGPLTVDLVDMQGRTLENIYSGSPEVGKLQISWNTSRLQPGRYFVRMRNSTIHKASSVIKK